MKELKFLFRSSVCTGVLVMAFGCGGSKQTVTPQQIEQVVKKTMSHFGYSGGFGSSNAGNKYRNGVSTSSLYFNHRELRQKARVATNDNSIAKSIVERHADTVVGIGLKLSAAPKADILGISMDQAEAWASDVDARFDLWAKSQDQHLSGTMSFYQSQRMYGLAQQRDNDMFVRLHYSKEKQLLNPLLFQFLDPDQIRGDAFTMTYGAHAMGDDGIIRDSRGREIGYKVYVRDLTRKNQFKLVTIPAKSKSGRIFMLHGFNAEYAGQGRGFSRLSHALQDLSDATDFGVATIRKAITQAIFALFVESDNGPAQNFTANSITAAAGPRVDPVVGDSLTTGSSDINMRRMGEMGIEDEMGIVIGNLPEGQTIKSVVNNTPSASFESYMNTVQANIAASMSIPIEIVQMKFNANYSASRAALVLYWNIANIWRKEMATDYLQPIYKMWLSEEIAAGQITAPGWSDPIMRAAWLNSNWIGLPMPNIDPMREAKATEANVGMGLVTLEQAALNLNGSDAKANRAKLAKEIPETTLLKTHANSKQNGI